VRINQVVELHYVLIGIVLSLILSFPCQKVSGDINDFMNLKSNLSCVTPLVLLKDGANNTSTVYTNNTSAQISIKATSPSTYNYSLDIMNNNASLWKVRLEYFDYINIGRVNTTIILHNNSTSSGQITISGGNISQTSNYYNLTTTATIHIGVMNLVENSSGTTILRVYLRIKTLNTTTYTLYIVTFEFT
jgi:hypothetical protein